jgi:hypothetical protein
MLRRAAGNSEGSPRRTERVFQKFFNDRTNLSSPPQDWRENSSDDDTTRDDFKKFTDAQRRRPFILDFPARCKNDTAFQFPSKRNRRYCRYRSPRFANLLVDLVTARARARAVVSQVERNTRGLLFIRGLPLAESRSIVENGD